MKIAEMIGLMNESLARTNRRFRFDGEFPREFRTILLLLEIHVRIVSAFLLEEQNDERKV